MIVRTRTPFRTFCLCALSPPPPPSLSLLVFCFCLSLFLLSVSSRLVSLAAILLFARSNVCAVRGVGMAWHSCVSCPPSLARVKCRRVVMMQTR
ncbi:hypothetical protein F5X97DRAFT_290216 [Nemania serpens]|nr:hypothetical protein F5X97DRAFT_290216 [Nemania serpens]